MTTRRPKQLPAPKRGTKRARPSHAPAPPVDDARRQARLLRRAKIQQASEQTLTAFGVQDKYATAIGTSLAALLSDSLLDAVDELESKRKR